MCVGEGFLSLGDDCFTCCVQCISLSIIKRSIKVVRWLCWLGVGLVQGKPGFVFLGLWSRLLVLLHYFVAKSRSPALIKYRNVSGRASGVKICTKLDVRLSES